MITLKEKNTTEGIGSVSFSGYGYPKRVTSVFHMHIYIAFRVFVLGETHYYKNMLHK